MRAGKRGERTGKAGPATAQIKEAIVSNTGTMKRQHWLTATLISLTAVLGAAEEELKWTPLFNGKDLDGWEQRGAGIFQVQDGCLTGTQTDGKGGDLFTEQSFDNFELRFTYRVVWPANSGVWFRDKYQFDILKYTKPVAYSGTLYCPGKLFLTSNLDEEIELRTAWNEGQIYANGDHLILWLNGKKTGECHDGTCTAGKFGIQVHGGDGMKGMQIFFKRIEVRPLQPGDKPSKPLQPDIPTFLTPETAGPDFSIQGEYEGTCGSWKLGAQVIALDSGLFRAVFHQGGLPGAGWDRSGKIEVKGSVAGSKTTFQGAWNAEISDGVMTGTTGAGEVFTLQRIQRRSPTEGAQPPAGAVVLLDGSSADAWVNGHLDERNLLAAGTRSKQAFKDFTLHLEFLLPFKPAGRGQGRANSGVYVQDRYEIQVLDSFGLQGVDNECGGIYKQASPSANLCFPPLQWQTYDIDFQAARFDGCGKKTQNAVLTVKHNGVPIHDKLELSGVTPGGGLKDESPDPGPIQLQGHGNPVFYRNIWVVEKD